MSIFTADLQILILKYNKKSATRAKRIGEVISGYLFNLCACSGISIRLPINILARAVFSPF